MPLGSQPKKELTSTSISFFIMATYHEWSQSYLKDYRFTFEEHHMNNEWFNSMLSKLKDDGELYVPMLDKSFNKLGEEINNHPDVSGENVGVHKLQPLSYYDYRNKEVVS